jgi:hypothetical protein
VHAGVLERRFDVLEEMLGFEYFRVAPKQPAEELFARAA